MEDGIMDEDPLYLPLTELRNMSIRPKHHTDTILATLENIIKFLSEDGDDCKFRRAISKRDTAIKDLIPILMNRGPIIIRSTTIKLLAALTVPIKDTVKEINLDSKKDLELLRDLSQTPYRLKEEFLDPRISKIIFDILCSISQQKTLSNDDCESVVNTISLLRNILLVPEQPPELLFAVSGKDTEIAAAFQPGTSISSLLNPDLIHPCRNDPIRYIVSESMHNRILWNFNAMKIDILLIRLLTFSENEKWMLTTFELINLFYKDQEVIQKLLDSISIYSRLPLTMTEMSSTEGSSTTSIIRFHSCPSQSFSIEDLDAVYCQNPTSELPNILFDLTRNFLYFINFCYRLTAKELVLADAKYPVFDFREMATIELLRNKLADLGFQSQLDWIKECLLRFISIRLGTNKGQESRYPIESLSSKMNVMASCPIIPRTEAEVSILRYEPFLILLNKVGLILGESNQSFSYPVIPTDWPVETIYNTALFFGPIYKQDVDFDLKRVSKVPVFPQPGPSNKLWPGHAAC